MAEIPQLDIKVPELTKEDAERAARVLRDAIGGNGDDPKEDGRCRDLALKFEFWAECGYTKVSQP